MALSRVSTIMVVCTLVASLAWAQLYFTYDGQLWEVLSWGTLSDDPIEMVPIGEGVVPGEGNDAQEASTEEASAESLNESYEGGGYESGD